MEKSLDLRKMCIKETIISVLKYGGTYNLCILFQEILSLTSGQFELISCLKVGHPLSVKNRGYFTPGLTRPI